MLADPHPCPLPLRMGRETPALTPVFWELASRGSEGIEEANASMLEVRDVARDHSEIVNQRGGGDQFVGKFNGFG